MLRRRCGGMRKDVPVAHSIRVPLPGERSDATALLFGREENSPKKKSAEIRNAAGDQHPERRPAPLQDPRIPSSAKIHNSRKCDKLQMKRFLFLRLDPQPQVL